MLKKKETPNSSKTSNFLVYGFNDELDQLKETVIKERQIDLETKNEMILDYWFCWSNFGSLILDWINLKEMVELYRKCHHALVNNYWDKEEQKWTYSCSVCSASLEAMEEID